MSFSRNHSRHDRCMPRMRRHARHPVGVRLAERLVAAAHDHDVARLDLARPARAATASSSLRCDRLADGHVALLAAGGDVEEHAARVVMPSK